MVFDNNTKIVDRQSKAPIPVAVVDKIRGVCKKNKIKGFFIFVNVKKDIMTRVKVSDENGEIPCSHKVTRRDGQLVNYLIDLSDERCVIFRQCSSI
jgi:rRNA-processing protein FCF1